MGKIEPLEKSCEKVTKIDARTATNPSSKRLEMRSPKNKTKQFFGKMSAHCPHTNGDCISCLCKNQSKDELIRAKVGHLKDDQRDE